MGPACQLGTKEKEKEGGLVYRAESGKGRLGLVQEARLGFSDRLDPRLIGPARFAGSGHGPSAPSHSLSYRLGPAPSTDRRGPLVSEAADPVWQDRIRCGCRAVWPCVCSRPVEGGWGASRTRRRGVGRSVRARRGLGELGRGKAGYRLTEARLGCGLSASAASGGGYKMASGDMRVGAWLAKIAAWQGLVHGNVVASGKAGQVRVEASWCVRPRPL
jgi:hypothetical protein